MWLHKTIKQHKLEDAYLKFVASTIIPIHKLCSVLKIKTKENYNYKIRENTRQVRKETKTYVCTLLM